MFLFYNCKKYFLHTKKPFTHIKFMRKIKSYEYLKGSDEREVLIKGFNKKELKNEKFH